MTPKLPDPYARSTFHGRTGDNATIQALKVAEHRLGYELTIVQFIGGATASAGTHVKGRAVDLVAWDWQRKVKVLRDVGFAAWYRPDLPGVWGEHIHAVLIFETRDNGRGLADAALRQIGSYDRVRDGLKSDGPDPNPYRPAPSVTFTRKAYEASFAKPKPRPTPVTKTRDKIVEAIHATGQAAALLDDTDESRVVARSQRDDLRAVRRELRAILERLPKR